jgi:hypothetical protein
MSEEEVGKLVLAQLPPDCSILFALLVEPDGQCETAEWMVEVVRTPENDPDDVRFLRVHVNDATGDLSVSGGWIARGY